MEIAAKYNYTDIINLGHRDFPDVTGAITLWNTSDTVKAVSWPADLRKTMHEFMPHNVVLGKHWHKFPGYGGKGKTFHGKTCTQETWEENEDIQVHIEGTEYRLNTVGDKIIQAHHKINMEGDDFLWEWTGVQSLKGTGILPTVKKAIKLVPNYETSILGWDVMLGEDGKTYVLEINTSAGVNEATAARIVEVINESGE